MYKTVRGTQESCFTDVTQPQKIFTLGKISGHLKFRMLFYVFLPNLEISWPIHICKLQRFFCTTQEFDQDFTNQITSNRFRNHDKNFDEITKLENHLNSIFTKSSTTKILFRNSCTILVMIMNPSTNYKFESYSS